MKEEVCVILIRHEVYDKIRNTEKIEATGLFESYAHYWLDLRDWLNHEIKYDVLPTMLCFIGLFICL